MKIIDLKRPAMVLTIASVALAAGCNQSPSLTPSPATPTYMLTVNTANPATGVPITVSYADLTGATSGTASFTRSYSAGTSVVLTAPATAGINLFSSWTGCTSVSTVNCTVTVTANTTVTATYVPPPNYTLTVNSTNPASGAAVSVTPADNNGATNGSTSFTRSYVTGSAITLTAPATSGGNNFSSWTGCTTVAGAVCNVTLTSSRTVTANYVTPTAVFKLTVNSTNPSSGVVVTASPADNNGTTSFGTGAALSYNAGTKVTLTAPAASGSQVFQAWSGCSATASLTCTITVTGATTVAANYFIAPVGNTYYVGPGGNDTNDGKSLATAFLTLQKAANTTAAGDVVYVLTGSYTGATVTSTVLQINTPGTATAPIAFRAYPASTPTLNFSSFTGIGFGNNAAYIEVNGFTINGNNQNVTFAQASTADAIANPANYPQFNGNCVFGDGRNSAGGHPNHISVLNNVISNCGAGIALNGSDYVTISGNTVSNCAWYDAYGTSAITLVASYNSDTSTGTKNYITGNKVYNSYELIPYHVTSPLQITDGEGIIIDTNLNASSAGSGITYSAYTGRTLIANNVIYGNGSSAIEVFHSAHVDIVNNASYGNVHTPATTTYTTPTGRGELYLSNSSDVNVYNNILYSYTSQNPLVETNCTGCTVDYNVYFNGVNTGATSGPNDLYGDPLYVNPTVQDLTKVDLSLMLGSLAIDSGTSTLAPSTDFNGILRPQGKGYDRGAFER